MNRAGRGFTFIEILVTLAIALMLMGGALYGFRALAKSELRGSATKLAAAIRYCFDRSMTSGAAYRLVFDFDENQYWAERSEERLYLSREKEKTVGKGDSFDRQGEEKKIAEEDAKERAEFFHKNPAAQALEPPPKLKLPKFQTFKDATLPRVKLGRSHLGDLYTPRQPEPYTKGRAYLHFFPDGHTERALIHLVQGDDTYSLLVNSLSGRVEVKSGTLELGKDFDEQKEFPQ